MVQLLLKFSVLAARPRSVAAELFDRILILTTDLVFYRGADKSLARPGRKQATETEDFDVHISYL